MLHGLLRHAVSAGLPACLHSCIFKYLSDCAGGVIPPVVAYPGGTYHTSCAVHLHGRLSRSASAAVRWRALLATLAATDSADTSQPPVAHAARRRGSAGSPAASSVGGQDRDGGSVGMQRRSVAELQQDLDRVLARGDPGLDSRLLEIPVRAYGSGAASVDLSLPQVQ